MSLLTVFVFVLLLAFSQWIADEVKAALPAGRPSSWCWAVLVHYALCAGLLFHFQNASFGRTMESAIALTFFVRLFFFMKRL